MKLGVGVDLVKRDHELHLGVGAVERDGVTPGRLPLEADHRVGHRLAAVVKDDRVVALEGLAGSLEGGVVEELVRYVRPVVGSHLDLVVGHLVRVEQVGAGERSAGRAGGATRRNHPPHPRHLPLGLPTRAYRRRWPRRATSPPSPLRDAAVLSPHPATSAPGDQSPKTSAGPRHPMHEPPRRTKENSSAEPLQQPMRQRIAPDRLLKRSRFSNVTHAKRVTDRQAPRSQDPPGEGPRSCSARSLIRSRRDVAGASWVGSGRGPPSWACLAVSLRSSSTGRTFGSRRDRDRIGDAFPGRRGRPADGGGRNLLDAGPLPPLVDNAAVTPPAPSTW